MPDITYPYIPEGRSFIYVGEENPFMQEAKRHAVSYSKDHTVKTGSVVVVDGEIVGKGANGSDWHDTHPCERVRLGIPTGERYDLCEGCHSKNHSEVRAVADAASRIKDLNTADLYLWGHWWACKPCWDAIEEANIRNVYLLEGSERLFNKLHPDNILSTYA